jgi:TrmH family RNA methyltransferase
MLSKAQNKYIRSLSQQKQCNGHKVFIAEGTKIAEEWLKSSWQVQYIIGTEAWMAANSKLLALHHEAEAHVVSEGELATLSLLPSPNQVMLVVHAKEPSPLPDINEWCIALDNIQDPGNMGTIIRIADWFGINHIICSQGCADACNPKVVQSAMGGHLRVNIYESSLDTFLTKNKLPVYAATLDGESVYSVAKGKPGAIIIGNESKGISGKVLEMATQKIMIPRLGGAESLNAAVSTGIICALLLKP